MRVAIVGAGIVGVTTAYELALQGHEVTVCERHGSIASESSFAHAGICSPGWQAPWAAPGMPRRLMLGLLRQPAPLQLTVFGALSRLPWMWRWWRACRPQIHAGTRQAMFRLALFSRERRLELTRTLQLEYEQLPGYVVLLRGAAELKAAQAGLMLLRDWGVAHELIDASRCRQIEPDLNPQTPLHAAIHLPHDGAGNCRLFAHLLKAEAQRLGARFSFDTEVAAIIPGTPPALRTRDGVQYACDAVVVCAGADAGALLGGLGLKLPLAPILGYSVTAPLRFHDGQPTVGPQAALLDERYRVTITRLGQRVRVAGGAEIGGAPGRLALPALRTLYRVLDDWYPGALLARQAQHWKGARPMLPDGPPVLGASGAPGVWLNLGHGASGWALACGSARVLAECLAGRAAPIDPSGLTVARLR